MTFLATMYSLVLLNAAAAGGTAAVGTGAATGTDCSGVWEDLGIVTEVNRVDVDLTEILIASQITDADELYLCVSDRFAKFCDIFILPHGLMWVKGAYDAKCNRYIKDFIYLSPVKEVEKMSVGCAASAAVAACVTFWSICGSVESVAVIDDETTLVTIESVDVVCLGTVADDCAMLSINEPITLQGHFDSGKLVVDHVYDK